MAEKKVSRLKPGEFHVWLVVDEKQHHALRMAAAFRNQSMSAYAKQAVVEAVAKDVERIKK